MERRWNDRRWRLFGTVTLLLLALASCTTLPPPESAPVAEQAPRPATSDPDAQAIRVLDRSMTRVDAGRFLMGSDSGREDERPAHAVYVDAFEIDRTEVSTAQYARFLRASDRRPPRYWQNGTYLPGQAAFPVVGVSWDDADAYCRWAGKRLPTEAEWEKACRGTDGRTYPWGETWEPGRVNVFIEADEGFWPHGSSDESAGTVWDAAWQTLMEPPKQGQPALEPVGSHPDNASPYGVLDMIGNASEWIADWYNWSDYTRLSTRNPLVTGPAWNHVVRGSPWFDPVGTAEWAVEMSRCTARTSAHETVDPRIGFRCARSVP
jgi:formylglycine-generating enzyme required for sulfatase activity